MRSHPNVIWILTTASLAMLLLCSIFAIIYLTPALNHCLNCYFLPVNCAPANLKLNSGKNHENSLVSINRDGNQFVFAGIVFTQNNCLPSSRFYQNRRPIRSLVVIPSVSTGCERESPGGCEVFNTNRGTHPTYHHCRGERVIGPL